MNGHFHNKQNRKKQGHGKNVLTAAVTVGAMTMAFLGLTQAALAAEMGGAETVSTSYAGAQAAARQTAFTGEEQAAPYTLVDNSLEYYRDKKPAAGHLSREEAATVGAKGLQAAFGVDLDGAVIEMAYNPAHDGYRANWEGIWWPDGEKESGALYVHSYSFTVDALSGALCTVGHGRVLEGALDAGFDAGLQQNAAAYETAAKEWAEKLEVVPSGVLAVDYAGQGATNNDPDISFLVTGLNGERARVMLSRYDKALLGVTYEAGMQDLDAAEQNAQEFAARAQAYFEAHPEAAAYEE